MRKRSVIIAIFTLFLAQSSFAATMGDDNSTSQCDAVASACKKAGFTDEGTGDKSFWFGCMRPVLLGKTVKDVTVDAKDVKECRKAKIAKMKKELTELQAVK
jgi:hypothetical protein